MRIPGATRLIRRYLLGDETAGEELFGNPLVYNELLKMATAAVKRDSRLGLSPPELISEFFVRVVPRLRRGTNSFENQRLFYGYVMVCMMNVLREMAKKRELPSQITSLNRVDLAARSTDLVDTISLVEAIERLEKIDSDEAYAVKRWLLTDARIAEIARELNEDEKKTERRLKRGLRKMEQWLRSPKSPAA